MTQEKIERGLAITAEIAGLKTEVEELQRNEYYLRIIKVDESLPVEQWLSITYVNPEGNPDEAEIKAFLESLIARRTAKIAELESEFESL
ncbi:hypothetical protein MUN82_08780 [Hymenobacter aerilatus]|uniref:Uncharacterized protein n=1 Tax=Hymenobacter aerilatus TaxID=2932251 RepID=A0A8T9SZY3_9BACT|nr:hypothetical protein [Hymenobacter aerilatus]UOR07177.1 hypothetical protein MUN82_08780 [Hymenobacter aerilatus]